MVGELGALLAKSWFTDSNEGGGGRLSKSKSRGVSGMVRGSVEKAALGVETWRVGRELLRRWRSFVASDELNPGEGNEPGEFWSLLLPSEKRDEMRFADLTGADNIFPFVSERRFEGIEKTRKRRSGELEPQVEWKERRMEFTGRGKQG